MVTSIDDLLTALDQTTRSRGGENAHDASRALHYSSRVLRHVHTEDGWPNLPAYCQNSVRRLAESCADTAIAFEQHPGRMSDLVGALSDAVATQRRDLSSADRWAIAARLAPITRRRAATIINSGPYTTVPELLAVGDRSRQLQRAAVAEPPELDGLGALDAPIPSGHIEAGADVNSAILEELSILLREFRLSDRHPATVREIVAVCHVASHVAIQFGRTTDQRQQVADVWKRARDAVGLFSDGIALPPRGATRSRILETAMRLETAIRHAELQDLSHRAQVEAGQSAVAMRYLRRLAVACESEFTAIGPTLFVRPGPRPLSDERVRQWLGKETFRASPPDLVVAVSSLRSAGHISATRRSAERELSPSLA